MIRRLLILIALVAVPATASGAVTHAGERVGTFDARGVGTITAQGKITAFGRINGTIMVRDPSGKAIVRLNGTRQRPRPARRGAPRIYLIPTKGTRTFYAQGNNVRVQLTAPRTGSISLSMFGHARVLRLAGVGVYSVNSGADAPWTTATTPLRVMPEKITGPGKNVTTPTPTATTPDE